MKQADSTLLQQKILDCYKSIHRQRMQGLPMLNQALDVELAACRSWGDGEMTVLLTPWFMSLLYFSAEIEGAKSPRIGEKTLLTLPAGRFEFIWNHEPELGWYLVCSLFSPVFEFADQETAIQAGQIILEEMFQEDSGEEEQDMQMIWQGRLPERELGQDKTGVDMNATEEDAPRHISRRFFITGQAGRMNEHEL